MSPTRGTSLVELLAALSLASDLGRGFPPEKSLRTCLIAMRLAEALGLADEARRTVLYTCLIHPFGCAAFTHEAARTAGTSELAGIPAFARTDTTRLPEVLRAVRAEVHGEPLRTKARGIALNMTAGKGFAAFVARADCEVGASFARRVGLTDEVSRAVFEVQERWDGRGVPAGLAGDQIAHAARIVSAANQIELFLAGGGTRETRKMLARRAGSWLDPDVCAASAELLSALGAECAAGSAWEAVLQAEPDPRARIDERQVDEVCAALADAVDVKSPWFLGHSRGVAELAAAAAGTFGLDETATAAVRRAGLVHDLGRLGVPNRIWDSPRPLSVPEWEQVRLHAYQTERILSGAPVLAALAPVAGMHHERLDGSGYHRGAGAAAIPSDARLLAAADVFHALTEPRPHRGALLSAAAAEQLMDMASSGALDVDAARAVCAAAGEEPGRRRTPSPWPAGLTDREVDVLRLLARGMTKKQIARRLVIAQGTVHTHTVHIYGKLGVSTRAGVAMFAMEHGLATP